MLTDARGSRRGFTPWSMLLALVCSAARGIFVAALYRYATTQQVSDGFRRNDLSGAWQPKTL